MDVAYVGRRKILGLVDAQVPSAPFPSDVSMPLGFPTPKWGKWQVRDVDVIALKKIPSKAPGYCYGKRVIYVDSNFAYPLWEELYDKSMQLWKIFGIFPEKVEVPGVGPVNTAALDVETYWDIQRHHGSFAAEPANAKPGYVNAQAPKEYDDELRYTTAAGLNLIMR